MTILLLPGGLSGEDDVRNAAPNLSQSSTSATIGGGPSVTTRVNKTTRAPPPRSLFSCFCAPFGGLGDVDFSGEVSSPQGSPRPLPVA